MKKVKIELTGIPESKVKFEGNKNKMLDYKDLIEYTLDVVPQGGFVPSDIRDRNRIQQALDEAKDGTLSFEDADYASLVKIIAASRWTIRDKDLNGFLEKFKKE